MLTTHDVRSVCEPLRPLYEATDGIDGRGVHRGRSAAGHRHFDERHCSCALALGAFVDQAAKEGVVWRRTVQLHVVVSMSQTRQPPYLADTRAMHAMKITSRAAGELVGRPRHQRIREPRQQMPGEDDSEDDKP